MLIILVNDIAPMIILIGCRNWIQKSIIISVIIYQLSGNYYSIDDMTTILQYVSPIQKKILPKRTWQSSFTRGTPVPATTLPSLVDSPCVRAIPRNNGYLTIVQFAMLNGWTLNDLIDVICRAKLANRKCPVSLRSLGQCSTDFASRPYSFQLSDWFCTHIPTIATPPSLIQTITWVSMKEWQPMKELQKRRNAEIIK